ncbi:Transmembrane protein [Madurella fahalii]|uniref:Transmembrane protein n=1 Tax=Madurella fahalii TaxID=1157608 RepID=A0ABQ0GDD1_9PEZI
MATATTSTSVYFPLATEDPYTGHPGPGAFDDGASGTATGGLVLSQGAIIAIIVVVIVVALFGIASSVLFFVAKKREWTVKETIRRSARKVVTVLTPRRSEFPRSVKESVGGRGGGSGGGGGGGAGRVRLDDVPPTPKIKPEHLDLEKGFDGGHKLGKKPRANFSRK